MKRLATVAAALAVLTLGCGGGGSGGTSGPTGVDRSQQVSAVSDTDKGALCDWFAPMVGGYGTTPACADYILEAPPDKATCLVDFPNCAVTVGQFEDCVVAIVAAQNACTPQALTAIYGRADCQAVANAGCFN